MDNNSKSPWGEYPSTAADTARYGSGSVAQSGLNAVMRSVYLKMTLGLIVTAFVSLWGASSSFLVYFDSHSWLMWVLIAAEFGIVFFVNAKIQSMSSATATLLFYLFSAINGLMLAPIFVLYTGASIAKTFFITAGTFGAMSVYGYFTSKDLSRIGSILFMALIGLIIASLVNIFLHSDTLGWIISFAGVIIFVGLTAWDTQQIRTIAEQTPAHMASRVATLGALTLYLDFINLFLYLLRFFGSSRD